jgi:hypothetical protein
MASQPVGVLFRVIAPSCRCRRPPGATSRSHSSLSGSSLTLSSTPGFTCIRVPAAGRAQAGPLQAHLREDDPGLLTVPVAER